MRDRATHRGAAGRQLAPDSRPTRRELLKRTGGGLLGGAALATVGSGTSRAAARDIDASVAFDDQTSNGTEVVVATITTSADVMYTLRTRDHDQTLARGEIAAGADLEDFTVTLTEPLTQDRELDFSLYPSGGGSRITNAYATITIPDDIEFTDGLSVTRVDANPEYGFNYPYFLYVPQVRVEAAAGPLLVEPNNTGTATDDFEQHLTAAREIAQGDGNGGTGREISNRLGVPFLVPAFPRPESTPVDWRHYVHQLDTETMRIADGDLARVDRQLLRMVDHAQERLSKTAYTVEDGLLLNGFSASGNFVNRFAALQPDRIISVTAGGINGMALLPITEADGHTLPYQIGVADIEALTGEPFDLDAFQDVNQFLYMGALDFNDTLPYGDAWSDSQREIALDVYGPNMQRDRLPYCHSVYENQNVSAAFKIYAGAGHTPRPAMDDVVDFHRTSMAGEDIAAFGDDLSAEPPTTDPDGDGLFEDINGDGQFDILDVQRLFAMLRGQ